MQAPHIPLLGLLFFIILFFRMEASDIPGCFVLLGLYLFCCCQMQAPEVSEAQGLTNPAEVEMIACLCSSFVQVISFLPPKFTENPIGAF
jgi:hypothetical protein